MCSFDPSFVLSRQGLGRGSMVTARHLGMWSEEKGLEKCRSAANMTDLSRVSVSSKVEEGESHAPKNLAESCENRLRVAGRPRPANKDFCE